MALSNIFREPRREITESVIGIAAFGGFLFFDSYFARWFHDVTGSVNPHNACPIPIGYVVGIFAFVLLLLIVFLTHLLGEGLCDFMANRGLELRPRNRR